MAEKISAELRTEFGKGAARRIRREHKIPAVVYGHGNDPMHLTLPGHDTMMALKHGGANALLQNPEQVEPSDRGKADAVDLDAFAAQIERDVFPALHPRRDGIDGVSIVGSQEFQRLF